MAAEAETVVAEVEDVDKTAESVPGQEVQDKPAEGTPDKALQKMQQDLGTVTRQLAALTEKKSAEGELSEADKAKLAKAEQRLTKIRQFVGRPDREDVPSDVDPVAEQVMDLTEKIGDQADLRTQLADSLKRIKVLETDRNWSIAKARYAELDTDSIWTKAWTDATEMLADGATEKGMTNLASRLFEQRCEAAKKRLKEPEKPNNEKKPGGGASTYKVGDAPRTAPVLSDDDAVLAEARSLVREI